MLAFLHPSVSMVESNWKLYRLFQKRYRVLGTRLPFLKEQSLVKKTNKKNQQIRWQGRWEGRSLLCVLHAPGPFRTLTSKIVIGVPWSFVRVPQSWQESFLNKLSFSPCFQLYTVYWVQVSEVSSFYVFYLQTYHWKCFQKCIVPLRRLEPHCPNLVWEAEASDKLMSHVLLSWGCSV